MSTDDSGLPQIPSSKVGYYKYQIIHVLNIVCIIDFITIRTLSLLQQLNRVNVHSELL